MAGEQAAPAEGEDLTRELWCLSSSTYRLRGTPRVFRRAYKLALHRHERESFGLVVSGPASLSPPAGAGGASLAPAPVGTLFVGLSR